MARTNDILRVSWDLGAAGRVSKWFTLPEQSHEAQDFIGKLQSAGLGVRSQRVTEAEMREVMDAEEAPE